MLAIANHLVTMQPDQDIGMPDIGSAVQKKPVYLLLLYLICCGLDRSRGFCILLTAEPATC